jgi:hypothetical protein
MKKLNNNGALSNSINYKKMIGKYLSENYIADSSISVSR